MSWKKRVLVGFLALGAVSSEAWAVVGRPLTPVSYAGVARRTSRRSYGYGAGYGGAGGGTVAVAGTAAVVAGATVASLPGGCSFAASVYHCGAAAYRPVYDGPNFVYVVQ